MVFGTAPARTRSLTAALIAMLMAALLVVVTGSWASLRPVLEPKPLVVSFIDIGQGDAALLQTPSGRNSLVDPGPPAGEDDLFDYLKAQKAERLDVVIASHPHRDPIGNMADVLNTFRMGTVFESAYLR